MKGIYINDNLAPWTEMILSGLKTIETRDNPALARQLQPGERIGIIRTGKYGRFLVGYATVAGIKHYQTPEEFQADEEAHRVRLDQLGWKGQKFGIVLADVEPADPPKALPAISGNRMYRQLEGVSMDMSEPISEVRMVRNARLRKLLQEEGPTMSQFPGDNRQMPPCTGHRPEEGCDGQAVYGGAGKSQLNGYLKGRKLCQQCFRRFWDDPQRNSLPSVGEWAQNWG